MRILRGESYLVLAATSLLLTATALAAQDGDADVAVATFRQGLAQYRAKDYVTAKSTLQKVDRNLLGNADKTTLDDHLSRVDLSIRRQAAAISAYNAAVEALQANDLAKARDQFQIAADSEYLPQALHRDAEAQLTLVTRQLAQKTAPPPPAPAAEPSPATQPVATQPAATQPVTAEVIVELPPATTMPATAPAEEATVDAGKVFSGVLQRRAKANTLLAEGKHALAANDTAKAAAKLREALVLVPELTEARDLLAQIQPSSEEPSGPLSVLEQKRKIKRQQIDVEFDTALKRASDLLATAGSAADFQEVSEAARLAENVIQANKNLYTVGEYRDRLSEVARRLDGIQARRGDWEKDQVRTQLEQMAEAEAERVRRVQEQLSQQISTLMDHARTLREEQKYADSLEVVQQILRLQPSNPWAAEQEQILQQFIVIHQQQGIEREARVQTVGSYMAERESAIPWYEHLVFPRNWREQAQQREGKGYGTLGWEEDRRIRDILKQGLKAPLDIDMEQSLGEVLDKFQKDMQISIRVKWKSLEALGYSQEGTKVGPVRLGNVTNEKALRVVLEDASGPYVGDPNELGYVVDGGELLISTKRDLSRTTVDPEVLHVRVYDTRDILRGWAWASRNFQSLGAGQGAEALEAAAGGDANTGGSETAGVSTGTGAGATGEEETEPNNRLIVVIRNAVDPSSWDPSGPARINIWDDRLVVRQTPANHAAIADLINELRRAKETQVSIEAKFVTVSTGYLEEIGLDLDFYLNFDTDKLTQITALQASNAYTNGITTGFRSIATDITSPAISIAGSFLDDIRVTFLLRATQAHQDTRTLTAPRLTLMSGTQAQIWVGQTMSYVSNWNITTNIDPNVPGGYWVETDPEVSSIDLGARLQIDASVSADLKYVTLRVRPWVRTLADLREVPVLSQFFTTTLELIDTDIQTLDTTVTIPDGATLLLGGLKSFGEAEREMGVPILSKIPIINRAFTNRSQVQDDQTLLILIKPTVIVPRDDEQRLFPSFP